MPRVEGSKQPVATSFFGNLPQANSSEEIHVAERARHARRKAETKAGAAMSHFEIGKWT